MKEFTIIPDNLAVNEDMISVAWCVHDCGVIIHATHCLSLVSTALNVLLSPIFSTQTQ